MKRRDTGRHDKTPGTASRAGGDHPQAGDGSAPEAVEDAGSRVQRRRSALKTLSGGSVLVAGGLLPSEWARPVIQTVLLPAHAQTSLIDATTTPIPGTTPDTTTTLANCDCTGLTIDSASATSTGQSSATASASGTVSSSITDCLDRQFVQVLLEGYTGSNCDAGGGRLVAADSYFVQITAGGNWTFSGLAVGPGPSGNLQSVDITVAFPLVESDACSDTTCVDAS